MKKILCQYAIVRFAPFVETGEFANVGIVMIAPQERYYDFQLEIRRYGRITNFFDQLDAKVYRAALYNLKEELDRAGEILKRNGFDKRYKHNDIEFANYLFEEIVKPRETIIKFGNIRTVLTEKPKEKLKELFGFYIERNFVNKEYQETALEKGVRRLLTTANLGNRYTKETIGNEEYHVNFPFVQQDNNNPLKIIKPLHLAHDEPSKILDHGGQWLFRIDQLKKREFLPQKVLFTLNAPHKNKIHMNAYNDIEHGLLDRGINVLPIEEEQEILEFASN